MTGEVSPASPQDESMGDNLIYELGDSLVTVRLANGRWSTPMHEASSMFDFPSEGATDAYSGETVPLHPRLLRLLLADSTCLQPDEYTKQVNLERLSFLKAVTTARKWLKEGTP